MQDHHDTALPNPGRRRLLALSSAALALSVTSPTSAAPKGPLVWLDMDQAELDAAYTQLAYAPNQYQIQARYATNSDIVRSRLGAPLRVAYGKTPVEMLDIYKTDRAKAPINILVHGGAWRTGSASLYAFPAELFVTAGAHFIPIDFNTVDETHGDLVTMADQVRRAVVWVYQNAESFGGDPGRIYLSGHSSGSHLAGVVLTTAWGELGLPQDILKGAVLCSGLYDLKPVRLSIRSSYVKFDDAMEDALSPQRHIEHLATPLVLLHGDKETPEFQRQTREFQAAVTAAGKPSALIVGKNYNHFELIETLASPYGLAGRAALTQMKL